MDPPWGSVICRMGVLYSRILDPRRGPLRSRANRLPRQCRFPDEDLLLPAMEQFSTECRSLSKKPLVLNLQHIGIPIRSPISGQMSSNRAPT